MPYLSTTKTANTLAGQQELINMVMEQLELDGEFDVLDKENNNNVDKLVTCIKFIQPFYSVSLRSNQSYTCYIFNFTDQNRIYKTGCIYLRPSITTLGSYNSISTR